MTVMANLAFSGGGELMVAQFNGLTEIYQTDPVRQ